MSQPAFTPLNIYSMVAWFDASRLTAGSVSTWPDSSGNGYNAVAGVAPTCVAAVQNNKNILRFNGSSTYLTAPVGLLQQMAAGTGSTVFAVSNCTVVQNSTFLCSYPDNAALRINLHLPWSDNNVYWDYGNISGLGRQATAWGGSAGTPYIWTFNTNSTVEQNTYRNNVKISSPKATAEQPAFGTSYNLDIGTGGRTGFFYSGDIGEIIMYNRFLSTVEITAVNQYLANKWRVTI